MQRLFGPVPVAAMTRPRGTLFLVVGPSGAGKDTLLAGARAALDGDPGFRFARRIITRPAAAGGEPHQAVSAEAFAALEAEGKLMLSWRAHAVAYGLPAALEEALAAGTHVVANASRTVVAEAARRLAPVRVIEIAAPRRLLAGRLVARAREGGAEAALRLARANLALPPDIPRITITNDGAAHAAVTQLIAVLRGVDQ